MEDNASSSEKPGKSNLARRMIPILRSFAILGVLSGGGTLLKVTREKGFPPLPEALGIFFAMFALPLALGAFIGWLAHLADSIEDTGCEDCGDS